MKKKILIIITGGTITMEDYNSSIDISEKLLSKLYSSNVFSEFNLEFTVNIFSSKPSPNFSCFDMFSLAKYIDKKIKKNLYSGVVVAHGTDTIEETSFFMDLYFSKLSVPIVFTGSMKIFTDPLYDGYKNLISSILVVSDNHSKNYGVLLVFNNNIMSPIFASKFNTNSIDAFKSINFPNVGYLKNNSIFFENKPRRYSFPKITKLADNVLIYKTYPGDPGSFFENLNSFSDSIIIEGFGNGNVSNTLVPSIKKLLNLKTPVFISSRVPTGSLNSIYNYSGGGKYLIDLGCFCMPNLSSQKTRIFLVYFNSLGFSYKDLSSFISNHYSLSK